MHDIRKEQFQRGYVQIDLDAVASNLKNITEQISAQAGVIAVLKADGYGHGSVPIAKCLEHMEGLYGFATATAEEAIYLRQEGINRPILVLGYTFPSWYEELALNGIRPAIFRRDSLEALSEAARKTGKTIKVHIKVDTGMNRIGIAADASGLSFIKETAAMPGLEIEGIFTHFARADEADKTAANEQIRLFTEFVEKAEKMLGFRIPMHHCSNSAGIVDLPTANMDAVRPGIVLYGLRPSQEVDPSKIYLKPALSLYSQVIYLKTIAPGQAVSYGGRFVAQTQMRVATIPIGYGDGYPRSLSGIGYVLIRGKKAPVLGRICMDQFMVDVTEIPDVEEGDCVTLIGTDKDQVITADELGELSGRFNYELVCDLSVRLPRVYLQDGEVTAYRASYEKQTVWLNP